jgi:hypothetical protein
MGLDRPEIGHLFKGRLEDLDLALTRPRIFLRTNVIMKFAHRCVTVVLKVGPT